VREPPGISHQQSLISRSLALVVLAEPRRMAEPDAEWAVWASRFTAVVPSLASSLAHAPSPRAAPALPRGGDAAPGHEDAARQRLRGVDMSPKVGAVSGFVPARRRQDDAMVASSPSSSEQTSERHGAEREQRQRTEEAAVREVLQQAERQLSPDLVYPDSPHPSAGEEPFASSDQQPNQASVKVRETPRGLYTS
jgi:hypothetical protein